MFDIETLKIIKEFGYGIVSLGFCFWLVREIVLKMGKSLDALITRIEFWNRESEEAHRLQKEEHKQIWEKLNK